MVRKKITFILGAGASAAFGFPSGRDLLMEICQNIAREGSIFTHFVKKGTDPEVVKIFGKDLEYSFQPSIDAFLEKRSDYMQMGKEAIAIALIPYETSESVFRKKSEPTWFEYLLQHMKFDKTGASSDVRFVTFNYDRSLEYSLYLSFKHTLGLDDNVALRLVQKVPIVHVYGMLGDFSLDRSRGRMYNGDLDSSRVEIASSSIKILHESEDLNDTIKEARDLIDWSELVCFLGFGFHDLNMKRIMNSSIFNKPIICSAYGLTREEARRVRNKFVVTSVDFGDESDDCLAILRKFPIFS